MIYCGENMGAEQIVSKAAKQKSIEFTVLTEVRMKPGYPGYSTIVKKRRL